MNSQYIVDFHSTYIHTDLHVLIYSTDLPTILISLMALCLVMMFIACVSLEQELMASSSADDKLSATADVN